jgi:hypothetical protein
MSQYFWKGLRKGLGRWGCSWTAIQLLDLEHGRTTSGKRKNLCYNGLVSSVACEKYAEEAKWQNELSNNNMKNHWFALESVIAVAVTAKPVAKKARKKMSGAGRAAFADAARARWSRARAAGKTSL